MGRFGIGARVRDADGDEATIIGKPKKGFRTVRYDKPSFNQSMALRKAELTLIEGEPVETAAEQWVPKIGDRVRYVGKHPDIRSPERVGWLGYVKAVADNFAEVTYDNGEWGNQFLANIEPVAEAATSQPTTPAAPAPLTIEAGKFYRTRDGRKVGPIIVAQGQGEPWPWKTADGDLWFRETGFSCPGRLDRHRDEDDLVAEWIDEPVVAVAAVSAKATCHLRFKIGDKVDLYRDGQPVEFWRALTITSFDDLFDYNTDRGLLCFDGELQLATPTPTPTTTSSFIVARLTPTGKPLPNSKPVVHTSRDAADTEAQRLADKYGADFAVYERVSVRELDAGPVPKTFVLSRAKAALTEPSKLSWAFVWSDTKWGQEFWEAQADSALIPLGRAILTKWIAQAEAAAQPTPANDDAPAKQAA